MTPLLFVFQLTQLGMHKTSWLLDLGRILEWAGHYDTELGNVAEIIFGKILERYVARVLLKGR